MANLIIKPTSGGSLILQDEGGTAAHTIDASGNHTIANTTTLTNATIANATITAGTFPTGHIIDNTGQNTGNCVGSIVTTTAVNDVINSGVTITIGTGNKALILMNGWFYTHISNASSDREISIYKSVDGGSDTEMAQAFRGGEVMTQYERQAGTAMCYDNSTGSITYKMKVSLLGTAGTVKYYTNMFVFEIKG